MPAKFRRQNLPVPPMEPPTTAHRATVPAARVKTARHFAVLPGIAPQPDQAHTHRENEKENSSSTYQSVIRDYFAELAARPSYSTSRSGRASHALKGRDLANPAPPHTNRPVPEGVRRYNELMAQIERNKQLAEESWMRFVAAEQAAGRTVIDPLANRAVLVTNPDGTTTKRYLTWNEEEDRRMQQIQSS